MIVEEDYLDDYEYQPR